MITATTPDEGTTNIARLEAILSNAPPDASPKSLFSDVDDEFWFWVQTEGYRRSARLRDILPSLPDEQTQIGFTGLAGDDNLAVAFRAYQLFKRFAVEHSGVAADQMWVLDFGCGWGRIIRFFQKDIDPARLWGADPMDYALQMFKQTRTDQWANVVKNKVLPPSTFQDDTFDLIYLNSVFSHLSEEAHRQWLTEFKRILKPGGVLVATTWGASFIQRCAEQRARPAAERSDYENNLAEAFDDTGQALSDYERGEFIFSPVAETGDLENYGEACIPKGYVHGHWAKEYEIIDFIDDESICPQVVIAVGKPRVPS